MAIYSIVYTSLADDTIVGDATPEIETILTTPRRCNAESGLHGALLFTDKRFVQVLEGVQAAVEGTFDRIARDPRHHQIEVLCAQSASKPRFADWLMAFVGDTPALRERFTDAPLADIDGQLGGDALLDFMLKVARGPN